MVGRSFKILLWKELVDLSRDKKTIATSILLPLIIFPMLGLLSLALLVQQEVTIAVVDQDQSTYTNSILNITVSSKDLVDLLVRVLHDSGYNVFIANSTDVLEDPNVDLVVLIPRGFTENASSTLSKARVTVYKRAAVQASSRAEGLVYAIVDSFGQRISIMKINALARLAGVNVTAEAILNPVGTRTILVNIQGQQVGVEAELKSTLARILVLALSAVITPAASFMIDGIIGERERKTIEMLISLPLPVSRIIYAKLVAATMLGLLTAIADALGFLAYMVLTVSALGGQLGIILDYNLLLLHSIVAFFTILVTISIALPFITRTRGIRSASNIASIIAIIGTLIFFTGFIVDYTRLPVDIKTLFYLIPYTHSVLAIQYYVMGYPIESITHIGVLIILSTILLVVSTKLINTEKLLIAPRT